MSATPPRARIKYSRGYQASEAAEAESAPRPQRPSPASIWGTWLSAGIVAGGLLAAVLLLVSEFTTLYTVQVATNGASIDSISTSSHDSFALIPVALVVVVLTLGAGLLGSRLSLLALGALGIVTLLIALVGDLPDAQATGVVAIGMHYASAKSSPSTGLYLETLGAVLLVIVSGSGLLIAGSARRRSGSES